ncbi:hypothetical protein [Paenibacillus arenosi]|uniref:DUF624 domain-containing protein n=1 Tax=Paenibacillus arenosi TaxID=2774142 RepID=A0ABR9AX23_9BACL|nr:hypothetical protein [Paenibacillus arenosi]MBD8498629.1 hypothetical protein [Paenibacillus arenosi]
MKKLSVVIAQTGRQVYEHILKVLGYSLICSLVLAPMLLLMNVALAVICFSLVLFPLLSGVFYACHLQLSGEMVTVRHIVTGFRKFYVRSVVFGLFLTLFVLILISSWWYYGDQGNMLHFTIAVFQTYFVTMALISQLYTMPLVYREELSMFQAMGKSVKLFLRHPLYTVGAFLQALCLMFILAVTVVGFLGLFVGMFGYYLNLLTANVLKETEPQHGAQPIPAEG